MKEKITAIIPVFNEEGNIGEVIETCAFADEIMVVDSFSTDRTVEIIRSRFPEVRLLQHEFDYPAAQKNWAIPQATHPWVFLLDADERASPELVQEVLETVEHGKHDAYWISRKNRFMDRDLRYVWRGDAVIRLFKRDECRYEDKLVHEEIETEGSIGRLEHPMTHDTYKYKGLRSHIEKNYRYSTWAAHDRVGKIKKITMYHLLVKPVAAFVKRYVLQGGALDGRQGFIISAFGMWSVFLRNVKIWRMHEGEDIEKE